MPTYKYDPCKNCSHDECNSCLLYQDSYVVKVYNGELSAKIRRLEDIIKRLEWAGIPSVQDGIRYESCPICDYVKDQNCHADDCLIGDILTRENN